MNNSVNTAAVTILDPPTKTGLALAPWTYLNPAIFELEKKSLFLGRWQFAGHRSEFSNAGDYLTTEIAGVGVIVMLGEDATLRAFRNVCRHRASQLLSGKGHCSSTISCPYHGWSYHLDGRLRGTPSASSFPDIERESLGLHRVELEEFHGLLFVRIDGSGPSLSDTFGAADTWFKQHGVNEFERVAEPDVQTWPVNWKVAYDNYLENYHIPIGHPGLQRMLIEDEDSYELSSGLSLGSFSMRNKLSPVESERRYQEMLHHADERLPQTAKGKWVQMGLSPNLGVELYPELLDVFQIVPLGVNSTQIITHYYGHRNASPEVDELRRLNFEINALVNDEDKTLCTRVQKGLSTPGYLPGPLSLSESGIHHFHNSIRELIPVTALQTAPEGDVEDANRKMIRQ